MFTIQKLMGLCVLLATLQLAAQPHGDTDASANLEAELLAVLRSDAPAAEKAMTCKRLAIHGSSAAAADLGKLLADPQLASWARIALEAIPGEAASAALRAAADSLEGRLLVGTLNSIGVRRDARAVDLLTARLEDTGHDVASAAAVALGRIGNADATEALRKALSAAPNPVRSAIAEGCVLCAERRLAEGQPDEATAIYDEVRNADVPMQRVIEATRGAILARGQDGIPLLLEQFQSEQQAMFQLALSTAREFPGSEVDQLLAAEVSRATPERAALIIQAMADRPASVVLSAVLKAAEQGPQPVRLSAIAALQRVGNESCLPALLSIALDTDQPDAAQTAKETLAGLAGARVDEQILVRLSDAAGKAYPLLLELIGKRRIDAVPELLQALDRDDGSVRRAALISLGETVDLDRLTDLVSQVVAPKFPEDAQVAQQALKTASVRMPDREACAEKLVAALDRSPSMTQSTLLEILAEVGGTTALQKLAELAKSDDPQLQDTSSRLLGRWNGVVAAPVLLDLAQDAPAEKFRVRALRGYIGLARKFAMPESQRAEMCRNALEVAQRTDEQTLVLEVLTIHPSIPALQLAIEATERTALTAQATAAALKIAEKLDKKGIDVSERLTEAGLDQVQQ